MKFKGQRILYYSVLISIIFHSIVLFAGFFKLAPKEQKQEKFRITTLLPSSDKIAECNKFTKGISQTKNPSKSLEEMQASASEGDSNTTEMLYTDMIRQRILSNLAYPFAARKSGIEGRVYIRFSIDRKGNLISFEICKSSGYSILDDASLKAIRLSNPFPPIPDKVNKDKITFLQALAFTLKE